MNIFRTFSRRNALKSAVAAIAAKSAVSYAADIQPDSAYIAKFKKQPGQTKIVCVMGDYWHLASAQERHMRQIFSYGKDYKVYFVLASRFLTAEFLSDTDLLITARYAGNDDPAWTPEPIVGERPRGDQIWSDAHVDAIIDNVKNRGMGWLAVHCNLYNYRKELEDLMGIEPLLHQEMQPIIVQDLNPDHPITKGIKPFWVTLDDQFDIELKYPERTTKLFNVLAVHDKRLALNGWCLDQGSGRVVGLIPGQFQFVYRVREYQEIFWRAAHWAMHRDIPPYPNAAKDTKGFA